MSPWSPSGALILTCTAPMGLLDLNSCLILHCIVSCSLHFPTLPTASFHPRPSVVVAGISPFVLLPSLPTLFAFLHSLHFHVYHVFSPYLQCHILFWLTWTVTLCLCVGHRNPHIHLPFPWCWRVHLRSRKFSKIIPLPLC